MSFLPRRQKRSRYASSIISRPTAPARPPSPVHRHGRPADVYGGFRRAAPASSIIPGAEITYHWEIESTDRQQVSTDDNLYVHEDTRFTFKTLQQDNITLHYHSGNDSQARSVLTAAADTSTRLAARDARR